MRPGGSGAGLGTADPDLPAAWDYKANPKGGTWRVGESVDKPNKHGRRPTWDTIRKRTWRTKAAKELARRTASGATAGAPHVIALDPIEEMTVPELEQTAKTGVMPERLRAEIEHARIPQRVVGLLTEAGLDHSDAERLAKVGDPSNLEPTHAEWHAVSDGTAHRIEPSRNPSLTVSLDERTQFPFDRATDEEIAAIIAAMRAAGLKSEIDLWQTEGAKPLRTALKAEKARRPGAGWTVP